MFEKDSAFRQVEEANKRAKEHMQRTKEESPPDLESKKAQENRSLREAAWHDLNDLAEELEGADHNLDLPDPRELQERVERIRDTLYSTFEG